MKNNRTVKWPGQALRPLGRAGRSLAPRRPAIPIAPAMVAFPAGCGPWHTEYLIVGLKSTSCVLLYTEVRTEAANPGMCDFPIRRESGAGNRIPGDFFGRATDAAAESHRGRLRFPPRRSAVLSQLALLPPAASGARMAEAQGGTEQRTETKGRLRTLAGQREEATGKP